MHLAYFKSSFCCILLNFYSLCLLFFPDNNVSRLFHSRFHTMERKRCMIPAAIASRIISWDLCSLWTIRFTLWRPLSICRTYIPRRMQSWIPPRHHHDIEFTLVRPKDVTRGTVARNREKSRVMRQRCRNAAWQIESPPSSLFDWTGQITIAGWWCSRGSMRVEIVLITK